MSSDAAYKDRMKYQNIGVWEKRISPASSLSNVNEITRSATREVDPQVGKDFQWGAWLGLVVSALVALIVIWVFVILISV